MNSLATQHEWAAQISATWRQSVEAVIETGRLIAAAKAALPHGEFTAMAETQLPFKINTAQRLMAIAADPRIANAAHAQHLPSHWGTLYELTKLDDTEFETRIEDGTINPDMERKSISTLIKKAKREAKERGLGAQQQTLPDKRYGVILADPEWRFEPYSRETGMDRAPENHYPTSTTDVIAARDVQSITAVDCVLFLWGTVPMLPHALGVMCSWGFAYKSHCIWDKVATGTGYWFRNQHEILLVGTRGNPPAPAPGTQLPSIVHAARGRHSAKPELILDWIDQTFPSLPKIELNRRGPSRPGWDAWGNESLPPHDPTTGEILDPLPQDDVTRPTREASSLGRPAPVMETAGAGTPIRSPIPEIDSFDLNSCGGRHE